MISGGTKVPDAQVESDGGIFGQQAAWEWQTDGHGLS